MVFRSMDHAHNNRANTRLFVLTPGYSRKSHEAAAPELRILSSFHKFKLANEDRLQLPAYVNLRCSNARAPEAGLSSRAGS